MRSALLAAVCAVVACSEDAPPPGAQPLPKEPRVSANVAFLTYPLTLAGESSTRQVVITNVGQDPLVLESIDVEGRDASAFTHATPASLTVESRQAVAIEVTFTAPARGVYLSELVVVSNAANADEHSRAVRFQLIGPGRANTLGGDLPDIAAFETQAAPAEIATGANQAATFVRFINLGLAPLSLYEYELVDDGAGAFALAQGTLAPGEACASETSCAGGMFCAPEAGNTCALSLSSGSAIILTVVYSPHDSASSHGAGLRIYSDDPDTAELTVGLTGSR